MSKRTISISPQFFNISKKKKKIIPSEVNINASNIRQMLLDKLKEHKKTRKIETVPTTLLQNKSFEESCNDNESKNTDDFKPFEHVIPNILANQDNPVNLINPVNPIDLFDKPKEMDKPYGNLKNGSKPTYKMYQGQSQTQSQGQTQSRQPINEEFQEPNPIILEEKEVKKTFKLGKSGKKISILIKNNKTRKKVEDSKTEHKKTHLSTIKNYLKEKNLIKYGTTAPSNLLREMYETSELCGGILNQNKDVLIHNFDKR
jgi:hypothetical protein